MTKTKINILTCLIGFSQIYAWATTYYLPAILVKIVALEWGQSYTAIVGGFSWALLIGGIFAPKIGSWIEEEGGLRPLTVGSLLMGIGLIFLAQAHGLLMWYSAWTIIGFGMALGLFNAAFAAIGRLLGQKSKKIIIRITLISGFATLVWPLTTYLTDTLGWRTMVLIYAIPHIILWAPLFYFTIPRAVPEHTEEPPSNNLILPEKVKIVFYLLAFYAVLRAMVGTTISVNIINMFEGLSIAAGTAAVIASLIGPSQIVGRLLEMYFGRTFDPIHSTLFWSAMLPFAIFILIFVGNALAPAFAIGYGMSNGVLTITMGILPMILFGANGYAKIIGKLALPTLIAQAVSPLLFAPMIEHWSASNVFIFAGLLGFAAFLCIAALPIIIRQKHKSEAI